MRRAQSVRHYARPSLALAADDLGVLREGDETNEDVLRRQLLEKDRECDRLQMTIQALQDQLAQRPPIEQIQELQKEYRNLELLLQGTQRENEKSMAETERLRQREKMLERELTRLAGDNWQANLEIPSSSTMSIRSSSTIMHHRSNTISSPIALNLTRYQSPSPTQRPGSASGSRPGPGSPFDFNRSDSPSNAPRKPTPPTTSEQPTQPPHAQQAVSNEEREAQRQVALAQIEQVRLLILGMDQRLDVREEKLAKMLERAEGEGRKYESKVAEAKMAGVEVGV